jgi:hypothetical protein
MSGAADNEPYPFDIIQPYLSSFVSGEYEDAAFLHLRRICEPNVKAHSDEICPIIVGALRKVAEYIAGEPVSRGRNIYDLNDFVDLLTAHCGEGCVLDGVDLLASYKKKIPQISGRNLAAILGKYESIRAPPRSCLQSAPLPATV